MNYPAPVLSPEEIRKVNEVMTSCNGDRTKAASILCMTRPALTQMINTCVPLKQTWVKAREAKPITDIQQYAGPALQVLNPETVEEQEKRMDEEFELLICGSAGMTPDMAAARQLQKAYSNHPARCIDLIGGSIIDRAIKLKKLIDSLDQKIAESSEAPCLDEITVQQYTTDRTFYIQAHQVLTGMLEKTTKTSLARAKIKQMEGGKSEGKPKGKPGFSPKQQNIVISERAG